MIAVNGGSVEATESQSIQDMVALGCPLDYTKEPQQIPFPILRINRDAPPSSPNSRACGKVKSPTCREVSHDCILAKPGS
jgi:hypothetical protein